MLFHIPVKPCLYCSPLTPTTAPFHQTPSYPDRASSTIRGHVGHFQRYASHLDIPSREVFHRWPQLPGQLGQDGEGLGAGSGVGSTRLTRSVGGGFRDSLDSLYGVHVKDLKPKMKGEWCGEILLKGLRHLWMSGGKSMENPNQQMEQPNT